MDTPRTPRRRRAWVLLNSDPEPSETFLALLVACIALALLTAPSTAIQSAVGLIQNAAGEEGIVLVAIVLAGVATLQVFALRERWITVRMGIAAFEVVVFGWMAGTNLLSQAWLGIGPLTLFLTAYLIKSGWVVWRLSQPGVR